MPLLAADEQDKAADYAASRGIIIADTKFEFGRTAAGLVLAQWVSGMVLRLPLPGVAPGMLDATTDGRVLSFTVAVALATAAFLVFCALSGAVYLVSFR